MVSMTDRSVRYSIHLDRDNVLFRKGTIPAATRVGPDDRYILVSLLGQGGSSDVFEVYDTKLERLAVIKVPTVEILSNKKYLDRIRHEIKVAARLDNHYTVAVYDFFEVTLNSGEAVPISVMEKMLGKNMESILRAENGSPSFADDEVLKKIGVFASLCLAVDSAHQRGIIHRDLKPENVQVMNGNAVPLDWGICLGFEEARRNNDGSSEDSRISRIAVSSRRMTAPGSFTGTPGYIAPETPLGIGMKNPAQTDVFALGCILYEWMSGGFPAYASYRTGDLSKGEARQVLALDVYGNPKMLWLVTPANYEAVPHFRDLFPEKDYRNSRILDKLDEVARKAFHPDAAKRYSSALELREAVLMCYAEARLDELLELRRAHDEKAIAFHKTWENFSYDEQVTPGFWERYNDPLYELKDLKESWHQGGRDLIDYLEISFGGEAMPKRAREIITTLAFSRLVEEEDRLSHAEREHLRRLVQKYDWEEVSGLPLPSYKSRAVQEMGASVQLKIVRDSPALQNFRSQIEIKRVYPDFQGTRTVWTGSLGKLQGIRLPAGYYVLHFEGEGFVAIDQPFHLTYADVAGALEVEEAGLPARLDLELELYREASLASDLVVIPRGKAFLGHDFYHDGEPWAVFSYPLRACLHKSFALSRTPVTVSQYKKFIASLVADVNLLLQRQLDFDAQAELEALLNFIPRATPRLETPWTGEDVWAQLSQFLETAPFHWKLRFDLRQKRLSLLDPHGSTHYQSEEPVFNEQPIHSITADAAEAYAAWRGRMDSLAPGKKYQVMSADEYELVARNGFQWIYPWGYRFDPNKMNSRAIHADRRKTTYPVAVGTHPIQEDSYADVSLYGVFDVVGNVRQFTRSLGEKGCVMMVGGSVRTPWGNYFRPASRTWSARRPAALLYNGAFRLSLAL
ncbi:MAG: serine/threonine protein kinase [Deltaproteobacteria bacterium]|nr:serine/threonine protein kinase [Deltaproteobacteria bacterium]